LLVDADDIRRWHTLERGWIDIGYHAVILRDGSLDSGRPIWAVGAGVAGWNADSIHLCMVGGRKKGTGPGFRTPAQPEDNFTNAQWLTLRSLVLMLRDLDEGSERIIGHREYPGVTKYCPSFDVADWLQRAGIPRIA
jgi:N-acetylmuramoyl-L-alanine amidase